jgi:hypothetical protein
MFEPKHIPLLPWSVFMRRLASSVAAGMGLIVASLTVGMAGYHHFEGLGWVDAFVNAAMILSGMGPVAPMQTTGGKLFAGCYALYSGLALILIVGIAFGPVVHRFLHKFHLEAHRYN